MSDPERKPADDATIGFGPPTATASSGGFGAGQTKAPSSDPSSAATNFNIQLNQQAILNPGTVLGNRYEILQMLGLGGMGAVYKAQDRELDRTIALKVIRPDLASNPEVLARFKQELLTARQVTHRNVVRIFDIGEADGIKFITMEYLVGTDLRTLLAEGKLPPDKAVDIIQQVCLGLQAAHAEGIIHRDLKPGNIMRDQQGRVVVMDFGLARSLQTDGMTQTGAMLGTIEYMSPEQARAEKLDARSDIFTIGLIFYELLTGKMPFKADSAIASLLKRTQERASAVTEHDPTIPASLSEVVARCLERDPNLRFQTAQEMYDRLDEIRGRRPTSIYQPPSTTGVEKKKPWLVIGIAAAVLVVAIAGAILYLRPHPKTAAAAHKAVTVLVADFTNHTGDPIFDDTLEPMFNFALEGASFINSYNRGTAHKLAQKLPHPSERLDEQPARLVAVSEGINAVVTGEISRRGDDYSISATALDAVTGNVLAQSQITAASKDDVVKELAKLAAPIRKALGDTMPESSQIEASRGTLTSSSLEAVHQYGIAMAQQAAGKREAALVSFQKVTDLDPGFARAYSGIAASDLVLGKQQDAEKYIKLALQHEDRMTERERYRVRGLYYFVVGNFQKCIEEYTDLVNRYPFDNIGQGNLAACHIRLHNTAKAVEAEKKAVEIVPKNAVLRLYMSFYNSYAGDFQGGEKEAREALGLSESAEAYQALAEAQLGQGQLSQAAETYKTLEKLNELGASMSVSGMADIDLYEGRFSDAMQRLEKGAALDIKAKRTDNAADKLATISYIQLLRGDKAAASASADRALANSQAVKTRFLAGLIFAEAGQQAKAQKLATGLAAELQPEAQAYGKIVDAALAENRGDARAAIKGFTEANTLLDTWIGHFELARAYLDSKQYVEADSEFDRCVKRRGEALELFMDNVPTYGFFPAVYYYQGRAKEELKSPASVQSYREYLNIRGKSTDDPLVADAKKRVGA